MMVCIQASMTEGVARNTRNMRTKRGMLRYALRFPSQAPGFLVHCRSGRYRRVAELSYEITKENFRVFRPFRVFRATPSVIVASRCKGPT